MALKIDTSRAFQTPDELTALVKAVAEAPSGTQESNWIEWKSSLDLGRARGKFAVAKAILGFSNRSPKIAAQACEGAAYMIVGAEPGNVLGISPMDHATLGQKLRTYADGPRWTAHDVDYQGKNVLVIVIEPPHDGDRIHALKQALDPAYAGTIYHRGTAHTEPANYNDIAMLQERLLKSVQEPEFDLDLSAEGGEITRLNNDEAAVRQWLDRRKAYIDENTRKPPPLPSAPPGSRMYGQPAGIGAFLGHYANKPEDVEKFENRVEEHLSTCKERLSANVIRKIIGSRFNKVGFTVSNGTRNSANGVQLVVLLPPRGVLAFAGAPQSKRMPPLPKWPHYSDTLLSQPSYAIRDVEDPDFLLATDRSVGSVDYRDNALEITFAVGDLRPGERFETRPITLIVGSAAPEQIPIKLIGRAMNRAGEKTVEDTLTVSSQSWALSYWVVESGS